MDSSSYPPHPSHDVGRAEIVLNAANLGFAYGSACLGRSSTFDWRGVLSAWHYYKIRGIERCLVAVNESLLRHNPDVPLELKDSLSKAPPRDGMKDLDDLLTIRLAMVNDAQFVDNDNYRDWVERLQDDKETLKWFLNEGMKNHCYYSMSADGEFTPVLSAPMPRSAMDIDEDLNGDDNDAKDDEVIPVGFSGYHLDNQQDASAIPGTVTEPHVMKHFGGKAARPYRVSRPSYGTGPRKHPTGPYMHPTRAANFSRSHRTEPPVMNSVTQYKAVNDSWEDGAIKLGSFHVNSSSSTPTTKKSRNCRGVGVAGRVNPVQQRVASQFLQQSTPVHRSGCGCLQPFCGGGGSVVNGGVEESWDDNTVAFVTKDGFDSH
ncbi:hypothetical protein Pmar_PMAR023307 [Perkinsus marinus ATCC 50983]|uniref:Uncharacterized protein n=1 Tax=Perkinsus marinus (strain ATCC 50983 / TXsc) TaxID=423536 RepID=C5KK72_PERM5|nr:hypothetical protein Pmar_PMAR023307 [Perkinsus marinus ATCC 50983]EER14984.1 hypothetical protein Pmar_PMAR023307 [Perkinsus marinus ATCC 50983]|eukprot:XP_002783188.1 hypothetical protein Pmar_PMAR023307 [Perkinsus marinus ATCC 50983]